MKICSITLSEAYIFVLKALFYISLMVYKVFKQNNNIIIFPDNIYAIKIQQWF